ncbi:MAG: hypothetical protein Q9224_006995, partial [Gallowayella concinna]
VYKLIHLPTEKRSTVVTYDDINERNSVEFLNSFSTAADTTCNDTRIWSSGSGSAENGNPEESMQSQRFCLDRDSTSVLEPWDLKSLKLYDEYPPSDAMPNDELLAWFAKMRRNVKLSDWWVTQAHRLLQDSKPAGLKETRVRSDYPADLATRKGIKSSRIPCGRPATAQDTSGQFFYIIINGMFEMHGDDGNRLDRDRPWTHKMHTAVSNSDVLEVPF